MTLLVLRCGGRSNTTGIRVWGIQWHYRDYSVGDTATLQGLQWGGYNDTTGTGDTVTLRGLQFGGYSNTTVWGIQWHYRDYSVGDTVTLQGLQCGGYSTTTGTTVWGTQWHYRDYSVARDTVTLQCEGYSDTTGTMVWGIQWHYRDYSVRDTVKVTPDNLYTIQGNVLHSHIRNNIFITQSGL